MINDLSNEERETTFSIVADDRTVVHVFSDDPVWIARLDKVAAFVGVVGFGREYTMRIDQLVVRKGKRKMSEEQRAAAGDRMRKMRPAQAVQAAQENAA